METNMETVVWLGLLQGLLELLEGSVQQLLRDSENWDTVYGV